MYFGMDFEFFCMIFVLALLTCVVVDSIFRTAAKPSFFYAGISYLGFNTL
jgi:hypothetical protein